MPLGLNRVRADPPTPLLGAEQLQKKWEVVVACRSGMKVPLPIGALQARLLAEALEVKATGTRPTRFSHLLSAPVNTDRLIHRYHILEPWLRGADWGDFNNGSKPA